MNTDSSLRWTRIATRASDTVFVVLLIVALTISVVDVTAGLDRFPWLHARVPQITLLALALYFVSAILERRSVLERTHQAVVAAHQATDNRLRELGRAIDSKSRTPGEVASLVRSVRREIPLAPLISPARQSILIMGTTLIHFAEHYRDLLIEKSLRCKVRILLLDGSPEYQQIHLAAGRLFGEEDSFHLELRRSQDGMVALAIEARRQGGDFEVRGYDVLPTANVIIVDPASTEGRIQVEILPYRASANLRPGFILRPGAADGDNDLFAYFARQYDLLWSASRDVTR